MILITLMPPGAHRVVLTLQTVLGTMIDGMGVASKPNPRLGNPRLGNPRLENLGLKNTAGQEDINQW
jgi:hypothetical protein